MKKIKIGLLALSAVAVLAYGAHGAQFFDLTKLGNLAYSVQKGYVTLGETGNITTTGTVTAGAFAGGSGDLTGTDAILSDDVAAGGASCAGYNKSTCVGETGDGQFSGDVDVLGSLCAGRTENECEAYGAGEIVANSDVIALDDAIGYGAVCAVASQAACDGDAGDIQAATDINAAGSVCAGKTEAQCEVYLNGEVVANADVFSGDDGVFTGALCAGKSQAACYHAAGVIVANAQIYGAFSYAATDAVFGDDVAASGSGCVGASSCSLDAGDFQATNDITSSGGAICSGIASASCDGESGDIQAATDINAAQSICAGKTEADCEVYGTGELAANGDVFGGDDAAFVGSVCSGAATCDLEAGDFHAAADITAIGAACIGSTASACTYADGHLYSTYFRATTDASFGDDMGVAGSVCAGSATCDFETGDFQATEDITASGGAICSGVAQASCTGEDGDIHGAADITSTGAICAGSTIGACTYANGHIYGAYSRATTDASFGDDFGAAGSGCIGSATCALDNGDLEATEDISSSGGAICSGIASASCDGDDGDIQAATDINAAGSICAGKTEAQCETFGNGDLVANGDFNLGDDFTPATTDTTVLDLNTVHGEIALKYEATCPASNAACTTGSSFYCKSGANFYFYTCLKSGVGGRTQYTTGY